MPEPYYTVDTLVPDQSVGYLIKRCGALMTQIAERSFESQPVSFTQWVILMSLCSRSHSSPSELSAQIGHDMGALTRVADHLERAGLVRRERSQHDRRAVEIAITPEGRRLAQAGKRAIVDMLNKLVEPYSKTEIEGFIGLLQKLLARMQECQAQAQTQGPAQATATEPPRATPARRNKQQAPRAQTNGPRTTRRAPRRNPME
jgi:DNA-binding MarR family transcriptional regulator